MDFEDVVMDLVEVIKVNGGVRVTGWIKPASTDGDGEKASVELQRLHVVAVDPTATATAAIATENKYTFSATAPDTRAAQIVQGHSTATPRQLPTPPPNDPPANGADGGPPNTPPPNAPPPNAPPPNAPPQI